MKRKPKQYDDDDGRTIVNMDVEGMVWHDRRVRRQQRASSSGTAKGSQMTRSESRLYTWYSLLWGFVFASVFSLTWILFVLFCTKVWFR